MLLSSETHAVPVFHVLGEGLVGAVLEDYPYATPTFVIRRLPTDTQPLWRVDVKYEIRFTENMLQRTDVLAYMIQAQSLIDTSDIRSVRDTVSRLLVHWSKLFPRGVPDTILD